MVDVRYMPPIRAAEFSSLFDTSWLDEGSDAGHVDIGMHDLVVKSPIMSIQSELNQAMDKYKASVAQRGLHPAAEHLSARQCKVCSSDYDRKTDPYRPHRSLYEHIPTHKDRLERLRSKFSTARWWASLHPSQLRSRRGPVNTVKVPPISSSAEPDFIATDTVITVEIYRGRKFQEFQVLGSQHLTALRDRIYCLSDHVHEGSKFRASTFYIEGVFYDDLRFQPGSSGGGSAERKDEGQGGGGGGGGGTDDTLPISIPTKAVQKAQPLSEGIVSWAKHLARKRTGGSGWLVPTQSIMEDTAFRDIPIRLGAHYAFIHQGNCEHIVIFTDIRRVSKFDRGYAGFPMHTYQARIPRRKCDVCETFVPSFVCYSDRLSDFSPSYFCDQCYHPLHYDKDSRILISDFNVFPYYHD